MLPVLLPPPDIAKPAIIRPQKAALVTASFLPGMFPAGAASARGAAFPLVVGALASHNNTFGTSHSIPYPSGTTAAGELLLLLTTIPGVVITAGLSGWTSLLSDGGNLTVYVKTASGSEGSSLGLTTSSNRVSASIIYRISRWQGTPELQSGTGGGTAPDPPSLTASWGVKKTLWLAAVGQVRTLGSPQPEITGYPSGFTSGLGDKAYPGSGSSYAIGAAQLEDETTDTKNPGAFTATASAASGVAATLAVQGG